MRIITTLFWIIIILIGVVFASLNSQTITLNYYFNKVQIYFPLLLLIELALGAVLGIIAMLPPLFKAKSHSRKLKQKIKSLEQEIKNLRTIPIKDKH